MTADKPFIAVHNAPRVRADSNIRFVSNTSVDGEVVRHAYRNGSNLSGSQEGVNAVQQYTQAGLDEIMNKD